MLFYLTALPLPSKTSPSGPGWLLLLVFQEMQRQFIFLLRFFCVEGVEDEICLPQDDAHVEGGRTGGTPGRYPERNLKTAERASLGDEIRVGVLRREELEYHFLLPVIGGAQAAQAALRPPPDDLAAASEDLQVITELHRLGELRGLNDAMLRRVRQLRPLAWPGDLKPLRVLYPPLVDGSRVQAVVDRAAQDGLG